ncbi:ferredoxin-NADP reductase [Methylobacterium sp. OAE515]|uniref:hypothetical protein n=1 Tax=Methylobacterium sp. OAE515 TaxID=2817895 RepID=UPI001789BFA3
MLAAFGFGSGRLPTACGSEIIAALIVRVSGGNGLTPMMSMLETITAATSERPTWYVPERSHAAHQPV